MVEGGSHQEKSDRKKGARLPVANADPNTWGAEKRHNAGSGTISLLEAVHSWDYEDGDGYDIHGV